VLYSAQADFPKHLPVLSLSWNTLSSSFTFISTKVTSSLSDLPPSWLLSPQGHCTSEDLCASRLRWSPLESDLTHLSVAINW
jgi:hypothetical protein